jgi:hypothetical protein
MFNSAAEEISQWAARCRDWAKAARTKDQRLMLQSMERLLSEAAMDAQTDLDLTGIPRPFAPTKS